MTKWTPQIAEAAGPRYIAIADALAGDITGGRLKPGDRLPTHRDLAWHLGVTVGTVSRAYAEAERRGLTSGEVGRGTFVNAPASNEHLHRWNDAPAGMIPMRSSFPIPCPEESAIAEVMARCAADPRAMEMLGYQPQRGLAEHRQAGAEWITQNGFEVTADQVTITAGAHHGMLVVLAAVTRPGDHIVADCLTYPGMLSLARLLGLRLDGLARDRDGPLPDAFEDACRAHDVKAIYLCPTLHNPTSVTIPDERRRALAAVAQRYNVAIVEDDVFGFLVDDRPAPVSAHAPELGHYIVGISKTISAGLRIGFVVSPDDIQARLSQAINATCWMACPLTAEIAAELIRSGVAAKVAAGRRRAAAERRRLALEAFDGWDFECDPGANFLWLNLPDPWRSNEFVAEAERRGVLVTPGDVFQVGRRDSIHAVRVCFGPPRDDDTLRRGLKILAGQLREGPSYAFSSMV
ncbi:PLP-dependent aminotransferase family protein [Pelagibius litoralis]|uniref:PLP-dependent aminotransferase family protein n=1 Tax=Pelagibius litoralis TaxID=374515 RepID=A0A967KAH4_9PROT|nr:PLP-dependent aminotransferase family protein [Pelagibius litoralis]NIA70482.1 PLP-dependent aminotransferase family protein [Pelagibius litoralis]